MGQQTGEIGGEVRDPSGSVLQGVSVRLTSPGLPESLTSNTSRAGTYRFTRLPIGFYTVTFTLAGFRTLVRRSVEVEFGLNATVNAVLEPSPDREAAASSALSPVVDLRTAGPGARFTLEALQTLPTSRTIEALLAQTPGVAMEWADVNGGVSGQQPAATSRGSSGRDNAWTLDGVDLTDGSAAALGASAVSYDFGALEQVRIVTGGADASAPTGGVSINVVTKSGSDSFRGSARYFVTDHRVQSNNVDASLREQGAGSGNPIQNIQDYGVEAGGPMRKGRAWLWGAVARQRIKVGILNFFERTPRCAAVSARPGGYSIGDVQACLKPDLTELGQYSLKVQGQIARDNLLSFSGHVAERTRSARDGSDLRPPETTWRQGGASSAYGTPLWTTGPTGAWKAFDRHVFDDRLLAEVRWAHTGNNFSLDLQSPELESVQPTYEIGTGLWGRSYERQGPFLRPVDSAELTADCFLPALIAGEHTIKAGYRWRRALATEQSHWGGNTVARYDGQMPADAILYRDSVANYAYETQAAWVQETYSRKQLTIGVGLRWDRRRDRVLAGSVPGHPFESELTAQGAAFDWLPPVSFRGADPGIIWHDISPRLAVSWDLGGSGRHVAKVSAVRYYAASGAGSLSSILNPVTTSSLRLKWNDADGDGSVQVTELDTTRILSFGGNYDPYNPGHLGVDNAVDPHMKNATTDEVIVACDNEIRGLAVGASYTWRRYRWFPWARPDGIDSSQWVKRTFTPSPAACPAGARCPTVEYWEPTVPLPPALTLTNHPDLERTYRGLEITARKRFSKRWMLSGSVTFNDARTRYRSPRAYVDPTNIDKLNGAPPASDEAWLVKMAGASSLPLWDVGVSAVYQARQGVPFMQAVLTPNRANSAGQVMVLLDTVGKVRLPAVHSLDLRVDRGVRVGRVRFTVEADVFNVANADTILRRQRKQNAANANQVMTILPPRVVRFGVGMTW